MPFKFSSSLENLPQYPFFKVNQLAKKHGAMKLTIGIPDAEMPAILKRRMAKHIETANSTKAYPIDAYPSRGIDELVNKIIDFYKQNHGVKLKSENIAVTGYTKTALHNLPRLFNGRGLVPEPVYPAYEGGVKLAPNGLKRVPASKGWLPDFNFGSEDAFFYFCDPNNPTGKVADRSFYKDLLEKMKENQVMGIMDKAYNKFILDKNSTPVSITEVPDMMDHAYEVVSFSKNFNFVGSGGLGWLVSSEDNINRWLKLADQFSQGVPWYLQKTGADALAMPEVRKEMNNYVKEIYNRMKILSEGLNKLGLTNQMPPATPYLWAKVPEGFEDEDFIHRLIKEAGVAFMPGSYFGESGRGYFRATGYSPMKNIKQSLENMEKHRFW